MPGDIAEDSARDLAQLRAINWRSMNQEHINATMDRRSTVIDMEDLTADPSFGDRLGVIREIHEVESNPVTTRFDHSMALDVAQSGSRLEGGKGLVLHPATIRASSLAYLCDEYALRGFMCERFGLPFGLAVRDPGLLQARIAVTPDLDLTIPVNYEIIFDEWPSGLYPPQASASGHIAIDLVRDDAARDAVVSP